MLRTAYSALLVLLLPLALIRLLWRGRRQPEYLRQVAERFGCYTVARPAAPLIWLHCVSVGETRAAAPLVAGLRAHYPEHTLLLTHATPTGRATGKQLFGNEVLQVYLPYDLPSAVSRFLTHFRPEFGLLLETELWFNLIATCRMRGVPLLLVNARLSEKSARGYARLGRLARTGLQELAAIAAQTEVDAQRLRTLGAREVAVTGNLKFDVAPPADAAAQGQTLHALFGAERPVFLAASTREGEETLLLDAVDAIGIPGLLTVIVPRHPQRFDAVAALLEARGLRFARRSAGQTVNAACSVVLGDSMGELFAYYAACDVAFIGGSLMPYGGQNLIEACAMSKPVLIGPHTWNFEEIANRAVAAGAAQRVTDVHTLGEALTRVLQNSGLRATLSEAAKTFSAASGGATERTLAIIRDTVGSREALPNESAC